MTAPPDEVVDPGVARPGIAPKHVLTEDVDLDNDSCPSAGIPAPAGPYAAAAEAIWRAGWWPIPLPPGEKDPPPTGWTGYVERVPSWPDVLAWMDPPNDDGTGGKGDGNVAVRLPDGVVGLDVDHYGSKAGGETYRAAEESFGPLPPTWTLTSRSDGVSGIRMYGVPTGRKWTSPGPGIDMITWSWRYAVAPPSIHPDTGANYRLIGPDGRPTDIWPRPEDLPPLLDSWTEALSTEATGPEAHEALGVPVNEWLASLPRADGEPDDKMRAAMGLAMSAPPAGPRYDWMRDRVLELVRRGEQGHPGVVKAIAAHRRFYVDAVRGTRPTGKATAEYERALTGACEIVAGDPSEKPVPLPPRLQTQADAILARRSASKKTKSPSDGTQVAQDAGGESSPSASDATAQALEAFWTSRTELTDIRRTAWARMVSPSALLGCVLARLLTMVPPTVRLPAIVGSAASLNLFVGLVGPSGIGKDASNAVADEMLTVRYPLAHQPDKGIYVTSPGSGEGITHIFRRHEKGNPAGVEIRSAALMFAGEVDALATLGQRQGSTLLPVLRSVWTGATLGHAYVDPTKAIMVPAHSYRLNLVVGIQPGRAAPLLDDADGGTPQRFLWLPAIDPQAPDPDHLPDEPPKLALDANVWLHAGDLTVPESIKREIRQARHRRITGQADRDGDRFGGHLPLSRLKVAQALAFLAGRAGMTEEDWTLAGTVIDVSEATRATVQTELASRATEAAQARGRLDGIAQAVAAEEVADADIKRIGQRIIRLLEEGPKKNKAIRSHFNGRERPLVRPALELLVKVGMVTENGPLFAMNRPIEVDR